MSETPPTEDDDRTRMPSPASMAGSAVGVPAVGTSNPNALPIGTMLGEFEITGLIGEGGFGIVYLVYDHSLQRRVALKEYMPSALASRLNDTTVAVKSDRHAETFEAGRRSFINEARMLAQFDNPSLVKVYRFWEANGTAYMVMPFYEGVTLKKALSERAGPPDETWLKRLLAQLLDALDVIHHAQCYHRDIAPDNILLLDDDRPVLLDFGAARRVIGDMTQALTVILKPGYAPLEQYAETPNMRQGAWTDLYALAAVAYFAITGHAPIAAVARMVSDSLVPLADAAGGRYDAAFLRGIDAALAVKPEDRPQNVAEFRGLLGLDEPQRQPQEPRSTRQQETRGGPRGSEPRAKDKQRKLVGAVAAVVLVAALGGGLLVWQHDALTPPARLILNPADKVPGPGPIQPPVPEQNLRPGNEAKTGPGATPPAPIKEKTFDPINVLDEIYEGRDRQRAVAVTVDKAQVRIGKDHLRFSITSSRPGYVYVLVVGTTGSDFLMLFPNAKDRENRIAANRPLTLPRQTWPLRSTGPAGTNHFAAIVSDSPRDFSIFHLQPADWFGQFPLDRAAQLFREHRGTTPLFAGQPACPKGIGADCSDSYGAAVFAIDETGEPR